MSLSPLPYTNNHSISFLPAIFSTSGRIDTEFLRLLFHHAHRESEEFFRLTGQLEQPNQDHVFSKHAAFFNGLKSKVGHIIAKATALRVNLGLNLAPSIPSTPRAPARNSNDQLIPALHLSHNVLPPSGFYTAATLHRPTFSSSSILHMYRHNITSQAFQ
jgi:hypothetical protein